MPWESPQVNSHVIAKPGYVMISDAIVNVLD